MTYTTSPETAAPASDRSGIGRLLRSRLFVTGVVLAGLGAIAFVVGAVAYFAPTSSKINHFQRVVVAAGSGSVRFDEPGNYVAYYESPAITGDTKAAPLVQVELTTPSGHRFPLTTRSGAAARNH